MRLDKSVRTIRVLLVVGMAVVLGGCGGGGPKIGDQFDKNEKTRDGLVLRIEAFREVNNFMQPVAGAYYAFDSSEIGGPWRRIMLVHDDDPIWIDDRWSKIINGGLAYCWMNDQLAISRDGGGNWSHWILSNDKRFKHPSCRIRDFTIGDAGTGEMSVHCLDQDISATTDDFGSSWK